MHRAKPQTSQSRAGTKVLLTFSGKQLCARLLHAPCSDAGRPGRFCRAPSSRSRQRSWSARVAAQPEANFPCKAQTRSPVGAAPFPWHERCSRRSLNEPNFPRVSGGAPRYKDAGRGGGGPGGVKQQRVGWKGRASYSRKAQIRTRTKKRCRRTYFCKIVVKSSSALRESSSL